MELVLNFAKVLIPFIKFPESELFDLTDLLAISIAADIVAMTGESRVLAKLGLKDIKKIQKFRFKTSNS